MSVMCQKSWEEKETHNPVEKWANGRNKGSRKRSANDPLTMCSFSYNKRNTKLKPHRYCLSPIRLAGLKCSTIAGGSDGTIPMEGNLAIWSKITSMHFSL